MHLKKAGITEREKKIKNYSLIAAERLFIPHIHFPSPLPVCFRNQEKHLQTLRRLWAQSQC